MEEATIGFSSRQERDRAVMNIRARIAFFGLLSTWLMIAVPAAAVARTWWVDGRSTAATADGSADAPMKTIGDAMKAVQPGDEVVVREGVYRERVRIPSGEPGKPIVLRSAEGQRAVITGCVPVTGWKKAGSGIWTTTLDFKPDRLLVAGREQTKARTPNEGWRRCAGAEGDTLIDPAHLKGIDATGGGEVRIWLQHGNTFAAYPITSVDARAGRVTVDRGKSSLKLTGGDKYFLQNRPEWIDRPGEWAVEPDGDRFKIHFLPKDEKDLRHVEAPQQTASIIQLRDRRHVRIESLEVSGGRRFGIEVHGCNDVAVSRCVVHHNGYTGISFRETKNCLVAQNIVWRNGYGISVSFSKGATVEQNDVGYNGVDGILVTWKSDDVTVRNNYVHHHLLWGHPDNLQVYRGVTNVRFEQNLLLAAGQSVMMEETSRGEFSGNMVVGCAAYMLIMGHKNAGHYKIHNNTLALCGYGCMNLTWEEYDVRENVMMTGHGGPVFGVKGIPGYKADRNLFFNTTRADRRTIMATDDGWLRDFAAVKRSTGEDERSVYADPKFRNAPIAIGVLDTRQLAKCTRDTWHLRKGAAEFRTGDFVEVNFDGVRRRVAHVDGLTVKVEPPLTERPIKGYLVANWGDNDDFRLDLRLRPDSGGAKLAADGGPVGSRIDIAAYQRGDFNADGRRDIPPLPPELANE